MCHVGASTSTRSTLASPNTGSSASIFFLSCTSHAGLRFHQEHEAFSDIGSSSCAKGPVLARYMRCCLDTSVHSMLMIVYVTCRSTIVMIVASCKRASPATCCSAADQKQWAVVRASAQHSATQTRCVCFAKSAAQHIMVQLQGVRQGVSDLTMQAHLITAEHMCCAADSTLMSTLHCTLR